MRTYVHMQSYAYVTSDNYYLRNRLVPITENGYPLKRIFKTDRVWLLVETFCKNRRFGNGSRFIKRIDKSTIFTKCFN